MNARKLIASLALLAAAGRAGRHRHLHRQRRRPPTAAKFPSGKLPSGAKSAHSFAVPKPQHVLSNFNMQLVATMI
jgi:hypothetical protein